ncbi:MAG: acyl carrier protein [Calditrichaeota bacterium]|nr:MAG: acyl carrier protein [Calditrichota bacterium]
MDEIKTIVKNYILQTFLPDEDPEVLTDSTSLIRGGFLNSINTLKLISFLEQRFQFETEAHEVSEENFDTLSDIANFVKSKLNHNNK